ncbi:hypothetical protein D8674_003865 [Pyrus ussuriensis x Pyrus communis]|uniref:Uncharacterized protein n=1 Tax=Pyrus ussuriensis x Pyrus communis TaxID=2448454 RepID=A0A5N5FNH6_9ROSA|nr:hypothetical protein D8674_003865 [Pyrus ussuriensis x Pyrus communis]
MMNKGCTISCSMQSVFDDLFLKILIIIVLKKFKEIAEGPHIYKHINIIDFETVNPLKSCGASYKISNFINLCIQCRNLEAFYMVEMQYFFRDNRTKPEFSGLNVQSLRAIK